MSQKSEICPFKAGDYVVYKPSDKGWSYEQMRERFVPGRTYLVAAIEEERRGVVEGEDPAWAIYWTEFQAAPGAASAGTTSGTCPFRAGDQIVYKPSKRGWDYECLGRRLEPGRACVVKAIQDGRYVLLVGDAPAGGGLVWTEFEAAN